MRPQLAPGLAIQCGHGAVSRQHKHTAAGHKWRGVNLGWHLLTPHLTSGFQRDHLIGFGHHSGSLAVAAHTGRQRRSQCGAPDVTSSLCVNGHHGAITATGHRHGAAVHTGIQREIHLAQLGVPGGTYAHHCHHGRQLSGLGLFGAGACRKRRYQNNSCNRRAGARCSRKSLKFHYLTSAADGFEATTAALGFTPSAVSLTSTSWR